MRTVQFLFVIASLLTICLSPASAQTSEKPNFLVIVADDMGWADLGFLGSSINTPNLDKLAARGVFMSDFYVAPTCSPTRAMLMTGVSNHAAGVGSMHHLQAPNQLGHVEYGAQLHDGVVTIAEALKVQGYRTMLSGKWHLAVDEAQHPNRRGFDRAFGLVEGGASHFADQKLLSPTESVTYREDGKTIELDPAFYSTIDYTDKIIEYIDGTGDDPFFAYLPYTAPHDPLQVPDDWLGRYEGEFDAGPGPVEAAIRGRLVKLGLLPADAGRAPMHNAPEWLPSHKKPWAERDETERASDAKRMEIYAAMVELLDRQIGRVISHLEATGKLDSTYVLFFSDNGASIGTPFTYPGVTREWAFNYHDLSYENMGRADSFTTMGSGWNHVSNTPFRLFKGTVGEGGVRSPLLVSGSGLPEGEIHKTPAHITDIAPTIFELAGFDPESSPLYEGKLKPVGQSLVPLWSDQTFKDDRMLITSLFGGRMARFGNWKATFTPPPFGNNRWELYDIATDPGETRDLAEDNPELIARVEKAYTLFAEQNGVIEPKPNFTVRAVAGYEGPCNWWCQTKFGFVDILVNRDQRNLAFASVLLIIVALVALVLIRRRRNVKAKN